MSDEIKKGLLGIVVDETQVSQVMPEINSLLTEVMLYKIFVKCVDLKKQHILILNGDLAKQYSIKEI